MRALVLGVLLVGVGCGGEPAEEACSTEVSFFYQPEIVGSRRVAVEATRVALSVLCPDARRCPMTLDAAKAATPAGVLVRGCGVEAVEFAHDLGGSLWTYDSASGALVGQASYSDTLGMIGGCMGTVFQAGQGPPLADAYTHMTLPGGLGHRTACASVVVEPVAP